MRLVTMGYDVNIGYRGSVYPGRLKFGLKKGDFLRRFVPSSCQRPSSPPCLSIHIRSEVCHFTVRSLFVSALEEVYGAVLDAFRARICHLLNKGVNELLGRERYGRRDDVQSGIEGGECQRCHSKASQRFGRSGGRKRTAIDYWGDPDA